MQLFTETGCFTPDRLLADNDFPLKATGIKLAKGYVLKRGTLVGEIKKLWYPTGTIVETTPQEENTPATTETVLVMGILTDDIDSREEEQITTAYITGTFNRNALSIKEGFDIENYQYEMQKLGLFMKDVQSQE